MKFTTAWANILTQNLTLRFSIVVLGLCTCLFCISIIRLAGRNPIVVERACFSKTLTEVDPKRTEHEVAAFIEEAISARFDSNSAVGKSLVSDAEMAFRKREQDDLSKRGMTQRVFVTSPVKVDGDRFLVDADRIISAGKIRSAISFPIYVELSSVARTDSNPYGLLLKRVSQNNGEGTENGKK